MLCSTVAMPNDLSMDDVDDVIRFHLMDQPDLYMMPNIGLNENNSTPYLRIVEQPASRNLRFRYECEGRSAGSIVGANSTPENRTHPTIQVMNYHGPCVVVVSAVTKEGPPYRPHPHNLVGREGCKRGICTLVLNNPDMTYSFTSLGIQCVKRRDIEKSLLVREERQIDPFGTGFNHRNHPVSIDLNVVRLCFQVFIKGPDNKFSVPLLPVVSDPIYDKKAMSDLTIMKLSHYSAPVCGGTEVILLCDRVTKEDIQVWFYEEQEAQVTWECQAEFQPSDVHKQVAIAFRTPRYYNESIQQPVPVFVELRRPSDNQRGEPRPFQFLPMERDPEGLARKRLKIEGSSLNHYLKSGLLSGAQVAQDRPAPIAVPRMMRQPIRHQVIKVESGSGATCGDSFPGVTILGMPPQYTSIAVSVPVSTEGIPTSHLTPVHSPGMSMSPGACSYASSVSPPTAMGMAPGMPGSILSTQTLSPAAQSPLLEADQSSPHQQPTNTGGNTLDDSMIEKFDSLGLVIDSNELKDFNLNLSASLFDSGDGANNMMENSLQSVVQESTQNMQAEDNLNHLSRLPNHLGKHF